MRFNIIFFGLVFTLSSFSQTYTIKRDNLLNESYTIEKKNDNYTNPKFYNYNYESFTDAFNKASSQIFENAANMESVKANRALAEANRALAAERKLKASIEAEERRLLYEQKAVKNPYADFQKGNYSSIYRIKPDRVKYNLTYFRPNTWNFDERGTSNQTETPQYNVGLQRELSDGTSIACVIYIHSIDEIKRLGFNTAGALIKNVKEKVQKVNKLTLGYKYDINKRDENNNLIIQEVVLNSAFDESGIKKGDVLISVNDFNTSQDNFTEIDVLNGIESGDSVNVEISRDGIVINGPVTPKLRDGFYKGDIRISGNPGYFHTEAVLFDDYGETQKLLRIYNLAVLGTNLLTANFVIKPKTLDGNLDFEFKRFKSSVLGILNSIKID